MQIHPSFAFKPNYRVFVYSCVTYWKVGTRQDRWTLLSNEHFQDSILIEFFRKTFSCSDKIIYRFWTLAGRQNRLSVIYLNRFSPKYDFLNSLNCFPELAKSFSRQVLNNVRATPEEGQVHFIGGLNDSPVLTASTDIWISKQAKLFIDVQPVNCPPCPSSFLFVLLSMVRFWF